MKAAVYTKYGSPDMLQVKESAMPSPSGNEVLVRVKATSVNAADLDLLKGIFIVRVSGPWKPVYPILGSDIAGRVEAVGPGVNSLEVGDDVYGDLTNHGFAAFAEYRCIPEDALAPKPPSLSFEEAAAVPSAGGVALLNLTARKAIQPGERVLINGAGGGMGTFAIQIAKSFGALVTGVDRGSKSETMRSVGADYVIDYTCEDFTENGLYYDYILDVAAHRSIFHYKRILSPSGIYIVVGGSTKTILQALVFGGRKMGMTLAYPTTKTLTSLTELIETGHVRPLIDRTYPLNEIAEALRYLDSGKAMGKVVITV
jgi:NADPH:quinone reductase-like Zn-dependent oxidoreductase